MKTRNDRQKTQGNSFSSASPLPQTLIPTGFTHPNPAAPSTAPRAGIIGSFFEEFHFYSFQVLGLLPGFSLLAAKFQRGFFFFLLDLLRVTPGIPDGAGLEGTQRSWDRKLLYP